MTQQTANAELKRINPFDELQGTPNYFPVLDGSSPSRILIYWL
jgi:hypothetical protein